MNDSPYNLLEDGRLEVDMMADESKKSDSMSLPISGDMIGSLLRIVLQDDPGFLLIDKPLYDTENTPMVLFYTPQEFVENGSSHNLSLNEYQPMENVYHYACQKFPDDSPMSVVSGSYHTQIQARRHEHLYDSQYRRHRYVKKPNLYGRTGIPPRHVHHSTENLCFDD